MVNITEANELVPRLFEHKNDAIHYRSWKFLVAQGVEVRAVHKAFQVLSTQLG